MNAPMFEREISDNGNGSVVWSKATAFKAVMNAEQQRLEIARNDNTRWESLHQS
jgi:hypothetical protein